MNCSQKLLSAGLNCVTLAAVTTGPMSQPTGSTQLPTQPIACQAQSLHGGAAALEKLACHFRPDRDKQLTLAATGHAFALPSHWNELARERGSRNMHKHAAAILSSARANTAAGIAWGYLQAVSPNSEPSGTWAPPSSAPDRVSQQTPKP